jgi:ATP-dependent Clp protease adapter protein ClpS
MNNVLICYPGGTGGNFIACLLRIFIDPSFYKKDMIPSDGCCDNLSQGHSLQSTAHNQGISLFPESGQTVSAIISLLGQVSQCIHTIHFIKSSSIEQFLTVPTVQVIYITHEESDQEQIAINKILKNFIVKDVERAKNIMITAFKKLNHANLKDTVDYLSTATTLEHLPDNIKEDLLQAWCQNLKYARQEVIDPHDRLLTIAFNDIMNNPDYVIESIGKFIDCSSNDNLLQFYNEYISKQPTVESYLNC